MHQRFFSLAALCGVLLLVAAGTGRACEGYYSLVIGPSTIPDRCGYHGDFVYAWVPLYSASGTAAATASPLTRFWEEQTASQPTPARPAPSGNPNSSGPRQRENRP